MKILTLALFTIRELIAKITLIILAAISTLVLVVVLLAVSTTTTSDGVSLSLFGNPVTPPVAADQLTDIVSQMQAGLAGGLFAGIALFGVLATATAIPDMLEKGVADVYLSKPLRRWELLLGRCLGATGAILANTVYFIGGLWLILGVKAGVWNVAFLLSAFSMTLLFASLYAIVAFFAVWSRNGVVSIIAAFLYLMVVGSVLFHRQHGVYLISENQVFRTSIDALYYIFPQLSALQDAIAQQILRRDVDWVPFAQSAASGGAIYAAAAWMLERKDF
jgi:ABC-type transport system involved in multi-copper enzyme maturation permease subunit